MQCGHVRIKADRTLNLESIASSCCGKQTGRASVLASRRLAYILRLAGTLALPTGIHSVFPQQKLAKTEIILRICAELGNVPDE